MDERKLADDHLELIADYLVEVGSAKTEANPTAGNSYLSKAIGLLDIIDDRSRTLSFERMNKRDKIERLLKKG